MDTSMCLGLVYNAAASDLEDLPIHLDAVRLENGTRILCDRLEPAGSKRKDRRPCA